MADVDALLLAVGAELSDAMTRASLTQTALARRADASPLTVSRVLRCGDVHVTTLARLAAAAGCRVTITLTPISD
jgi:transcriptional regulator with XRE-family HTH domain